MIFIYFAVFLFFFSFETTSHLRSLIITGLRVVIFLKFENTLWLKMFSIVKKKHNIKHTNKFFLFFFKINKTNSFLIKYLLKYQMLLI